jgi:hypothetical protein
MDWIDQAQIMDRLQAVSLLFLESQVAHFHKKGSMLRDKGPI